MKKLFTLLFLCGALLVRAQYPLISIHDAQYVTLQNLANGIDTAITFGDTVQIEGVVMFDPCDYGLSTTGSRLGTFITDPAGGAWNGVHVMIDAAAIGYSGTLHQLDQDVLFRDNSAVGNIVRYTGIVSGFSNNTQILCIPTQCQVMGTVSSLPTPPVVTIDSLMLNDGTGTMVIQKPTGEQWEGQYVELDNVVIVDVSAGTGNSTGRWFWSAQDAAGNKIKIRDVSGWVRNDTSDNFCFPGGTNTPWQFNPLPIQNATISFLKGFIVEYVSSQGVDEYYIAPRDTFDIGDVTSAPPTISYLHVSNPVISTTQTQTVSATITDFDGSVASADLYYSVGLGNQTYTMVPMTNSSGSLWTANIPAITPDSTYVNYWVKAFDNDGNFSNYPDSLATNRFYLVLNSGVNSIHDIQWNPNHIGSSFYSGYKFNMDITATVMSTTGIYDLGIVSIQEGTNPYQGIMLRGNTTNPVDAMQRGDIVHITNARVTESFGVTYLDSVTYTLVSPGNPLYAPIMSTNKDSIRLNKFDYTEPYESMLVGYDTVFVINQNPDAPSAFGEWLIADSTTATVGLRCDDKSYDLPDLVFATDSLLLNEQLDYIYGELTFSFGNWKLWPRNRDDIEGFQTITPIIIVCPGDHQIMAYPSPASQTLTLRMPDATQTQINVFDIAGKLVKSFTTSQSINDIPVSGWNNGIYILQIQNASYHQTIKVVVSH